MHPFSLRAVYRASILFAAVPTAAAARVRAACDRELAGRPGATIHPPSPRPVGKPRYLTPGTIASTPLRSALRRLRRSNVKKILLLVALLALGVVIAKKVRAA
jgi:hypothetical protein